MIQTLRVTHYRCLKAVEVSLTPLTVLMGPSAQGKSALLRSLEPSVAIGYRDYWRHDTTHPVTIELEFDAGPPSYRAVAPTWTRGDANRPVRTYTHQVVELDPKQLRQPVHVAHETKLNTTGMNLANVFASLPRADQLSLAKQLCALFPVFSDVDVRPYQTRSGQHRLLFQDSWGKNLWYTADEVSDGTVLLLALLALPHQAERPDVLCIEAPERGLHPQLLGPLVTLFRELSTGADGGPPVQVVLATHCADWLDWVQPEEVQFVQRNTTNGATQVQRASLNPSSWRQAYRNHNRKTP